MELGYDSISQFLNFIFPFLMSRIINASSIFEGLILTYKQDTELYWFIIQNADVNLLYKLKIFI